MYTVKRGDVNLSIIDGVTKGVDFIAAANTENLIKAALTLMNERDSINRILLNPSGMYQRLYSGISDKNKEAELTTSLVRSKPNEPIYAKDINVLIKYTNELSSTTAKSRYVMKSAECAYYQDNITIHKIENPAVIPDRQDVDPITGVPIFNPNGTPKMVPGFRNPVPVLDENGNPTYYTVTHEPIVVEGPEILTPDITQIIRICNNLEIPCNNRSILTGWKRSDMTSGGNRVGICTNINRMQMVLETISDSSSSNIPSVEIGELIKADTFTHIAKNLRSISEAIGDQSKIIDNDGACNSACQLRCQVSCQLSCQLSCQSCYGGTCHDQNCGGFSILWLTAGISQFLGGLIDIIK